MLTLDQLQARTFDAQVCAEASLADLNEEHFLLSYRKKVIAEDIIAANGRSAKKPAAITQSWLFASFC